MLVNTTFVPAAFTPTATSVVPFQPMAATSALVESHGVVRAVQVTPSGLVAIRLPELFDPAATHRLRLSAHTIPTVPPSSNVDVCAVHVAPVGDVISVLAGLPPSPAPPAKNLLFV